MASLPENDIQIITISLSAEDEWEPKVDIDDLDEFTAIGVMVKALVGMVLAAPEDD